MSNKAVDTNIRFKLKASINTGVENSLNRGKELGVKKTKHDKLNDLIEMGLIYENNLNNKAS